MNATHRVDEMRKWQVALGDYKGHKAVATIVSVIPNVMYPWDPVVVRAIRDTFDPDFVPVWITKVYRSKAGGELVRGYHGVASSERNLGSKPPAWTRAVLMPTSDRLGLQRPTTIHMHLQHLDEQRQPIDGMFVAFDWLVFRGLQSARHLFMSQSQDDRERYIDEHGDAAQKRRAKEKAIELAEYRTRHDAAYLKHHTDQITREDARRLIWEKNHPPAYQAQQYAFKAHQEVA